MKPFTDVVGFNSQKRQVRLGQIAEGRTIKEAIVAIPYTMMLSSADCDASKNNRNQQTKKFFSIDREKINADKPPTRAHRSAPHRCALRPRPRSSQNPRIQCKRTMAPRQQLRRHLHHARRPRTSQRCPKRSLSNPHPRRRRHTHRPRIPISLFSLGRI